MEELEIVLNGLRSKKALLMKLQQIEDTQIRCQVASQLVETIYEIHGKKNDQNSKLDDSQGVEIPNQENALGVVGELQFLQPKGKHVLSFHKDLIAIQSTRCKVAVPFDSIEKICMLENPPRNEISSRKLVYLVIAMKAESGVKHGKRSLDVVVIEIGENQQSKFELRVQEKAEEMCGLTLVVFCKTLSLLGIKPDLFVVTDQTCFRSLQGFSGLDTYVRAAQGKLFPLKNCLCFVGNQSVYIPHAQILSCQLDRLQLSVQSFDWCIRLKDKKAIEFSAINKNEHISVENYIRKYNFNNQKRTYKEVEEASEAGSSDEEEDDEDYNPLSPKKRKLNDKDSNVSQDEGSVLKVQTSSKKMQIGLEEEVDVEAEEDDSDEEVGEEAELVSEDDVSLQTFQRYVKETGQ